jgi:hypothetical protein
MTSKIVARAAAFANDDENACMVAGFSEFADGSGIALLFQVSAHEPDEQELRLGWDTYCITNGDRTHYGGLRLAVLDPLSNRLALTFNREAAETLDLEEEVQVTFEVDERAMRSFRDGFLAVVRVPWGRKDALPTLSGF